MIQAVVKKGKVLPQNVPAPATSEGHVLIKVHYSCISAGTEMMNVNVTKKSLIKRAIDSPEDLKEVINFAKANGIKKTIQRVQGVVEGGKQTGYSVAGVVISKGSDVNTFEIGENVAAAGMALANHAEYVNVPVNLVMKMPEGLDHKLASTVTMGGIAMQGVRRADLRLGESCVVVGAGILGLIALQILKSSGVKVLVSDVDEYRLNLAKELGADKCINPLMDDVVEDANNFSGGHGVDCVLFTAATSDSKPLSDSFKMCRKKGKVVLVGNVGLEINRADIYKKELDFKISTSYGPGRYESNYEEKGLDYPIGYVRWTENRNMSEYLNLLNKKKINVSQLIDSIYPIEKVEEAFNSFSSEGRKPIMVLLEYNSKELDRKTVISTKAINKKVINVGIVGAGNFVTGMHLPNINNMKSKFNTYAVMNHTGFKAKTVAEQFGANYATTDFNDLLNDENVDLIFITTRPDSHAEYVIKSLEAGKHTFVEKPLATNSAELNRIKEFYNTHKKDNPVLMTGFNRRFSKFTSEIKNITDNRDNPLFIQYRMNAGYIPSDAWQHDHGGRIIVEACHMIDLMTSLTGSKIQSISSEKLTSNNQKFLSQDNVSIILKYEDGSVCNIQYFSCGGKDLSKEYMEVHFDEKTIIMDDYKTLRGFGAHINEINLKRSDKGQKEELEALYKSIINGSSWPISLEDMIQTTEATFLINDGL